MLTGDQRATAESIARDLGILAEGSETLDGQDVEALSADALRRALANPWAVAAVPTVLALQFATVAWAPLGRVLGTVELAPADWMYVVALSVVPALVGQVIESSQSARAGRSGGSKS